MPGLPLAHINHRTTGRPVPNQSVLLTTGEIYLGTGVQPHCSKWDISSVNWSLILWYIITKEKSDIAIIDLMQLYSTVFYDHYKHKEQNFLLTVETPGNSGTGQTLVPSLPVTWVVSCRKDASQSSTNRTLWGVLTHLVRKRSSDDSYFT